MTTITAFRCTLCKHYRGRMRCKAYPEKIPEDIIFGRDLHDNVRKDQKNKIVYQPRRY